MSEGKVLSADDILSAQDRETKRVSVPEWGGDVFLRTISGYERDRFEAETFRQDEPNYENLRARYLALTIVDAEGKRLFSRNDVKKLGNKAAPVLDRLFTEAARINAMNRKDVDELLGNSEADPSGDSTSG